MSSARELEELREREGGRDRELDLLRFEIEEIEAVGPSEPEEAELLVQRERLRRLDALVAAAGGGAEAIAPESGESGVAAVLAEAEQLAGAVAGVDPALDDLAERLATLRIEADDLGGELRGYAAALEGEPGRLEEVEGRLELYDRLRRKHGGSVAAVLAHAEGCREKRALLESVEVEAERAQSELAEALADRDRLAGELTAARREAGAAARGAGPRGAGEPRVGGSRVRGPARAARGDRRERRRAGGAHARAEPGGAGRSAARDRLGR